MQTYQFFLKDEAATLELGTTLARCLPAGLVCFLEGDLGAGKTALTRAILRALGVTGTVKSPTYTLVESYPLMGDCAAYHFDFYRFNDPLEWEEAGFRDLFTQNALCFIEWPNRAEGLIPSADVMIRLSVEGTGRRAELSAYSEKGKQCLTPLIPSAAIS